MLSATGRPAALLPLLLFVTLLPSIAGLFNFGVDLYADLKAAAPFGGGPFLTPLALTLFIGAALIGQYGFLPVRTSDVVTSLRRFRQLVHGRRLRRHLHPETIDKVIQALETLDAATSRYRTAPAVQMRRR